VKAIGKPAMIQSFDPAPKGDFVRVTTVQEPFSYVVPMSSFGRKEEVWDLEGKMLVELSNRRMNTNEDAPPAPDPRRSLTWRPDGNGFSYIQAETPARPGGSGAGGGGNSGGDDGEQGRGGAGQRGGAGAQTENTNRKDRIFQWTAPFGKDDAKVIYSAENAIGSVQYSADCQTIYITETLQGNQTLSQVSLANPSVKTKVYSYRPAGANEPDNSPGTLMAVDGPLGVSVIKPVDNHVFLRGTQTYRDYEKEAPRPFLSKVNLANAEITRIWQSPADAYETLGGFLAEDGSRLVIHRETPTEIDQSFLFENGARGRQLTENVDPAPDLTMAQRHRIMVTRPDGFKFLVRVTVPRHHIKGNKLPAMFWFYPREFADQAAYDRSLRSYNKNTFPTIGNTNMALLTRMGYAFVEPDCPIVGPTGRVNDYFVNDLRSNMAAVIDELERQGFIDRTKLALGGHSYGGFGTANAMVHTPFFKAGIAGAGNYNRTLTPIAFQGESRMLTEARATYLDMSPILYAEQLTGALLMYCGMDDQNVGTDPINSERMFNVLESIGKTAALYMYPYEDHGQVAKETVQDMWARWVAWLQKYVEGK
jgi:dipeptidyl aminopeptidase/acylaminoacyl peptidase